MRIYASELTENDIEQVFSSLQRLDDKVRRGKREIGGEEKEGAQGGTGETPTNEQFSFVSLVKILYQTHAFSRGVVPKQFEEKKSSEEGEQNVQSLSPAKISLLPSLSSSDSPVTNDLTSSPQCSIPNSPNSFGSLLIRRLSSPSCSPPPRVLSCSSSESALLNSPRTLSGAGFYSPPLPPRIPTPPPPPPSSAHSSQSTSPSKSISLPPPLSPPSGSNTKHNISFFFWLFSQFYFNCQQKKRKKGKNKQTTHPLPKFNEHVLLSLPLVLPSLPLVLPSPPLVLPSLHYQLFSSWQDLLLLWP